MVLSVFYVIGIVMITSKSFFMELCLGLNIAGGLSNINASEQADVNMVFQCTISCIQCFRDYKEQKPNEESWSFVHFMNRVLGYKKPLRARKTTLWKKMQEKFNTCPEIRPFIEYAAAAIFDSIDENGSDLPADDIMKKAIEKLSKGIRPFPGQES